MAINLQEEYNKTNIQSIIEQLEDDLVGLTPVKARIKEIAALLLVQRLRKNLGLGISVINDNVFIGSNSSLIAPLKIEKNSTVGAGSVISKNISKNSLGITRADQLEIKNYKKKKKK